MPGLPPSTGTARCASPTSRKAAIALCEDGYPAHRLMCEIISEHASEYAEWESSAAIFLAAGARRRRAKGSIKKTSVARSG